MPNFKHKTMKKNNMIKLTKKKENMNTMQLEKIKRSNAKVDDLYRKIDCNDNQWFALDFILDHLTEKEKVKVRSYIKGLIKEEKETPKTNW